MGGLITAYLVANDENIRQHIASVVTFDSPLRGRENIESVPGFLLGACDDESPAVQDMRTDSDVVAEAATAAGFVPFYTWDATENDVFTFELVPGQFTTLAEAESGFSETPAPLEMVDNHSSIWDCPFDESEGGCESEGRDKAELIGCAIRVVDNCEFSGVDDITPGDTRFASAEVPDGSSSAGFVASWFGSTVILTLITPGGVAIDPFNLPPGATHVVGLNFESYEIPNPEPGTWILELFGEDVPAEGEDVIILLDIDGPMIEGLVPIAIDIAPGSDPNSINCNAKKRIISVAILTTEDSDAMTVDHTTVTFEGASEIHVNKKTGEPLRHEEDVDGDGDTDLVFHSRLGDTSLVCESIEGGLTGQTFAGQAIEGLDAIRMVDQGGGKP